MRRQPRLSQPDVLSSGLEAWTNKWVERHRAGKAWRWPERDGNGVNVEIIQHLRKQSAGHCTFCDGFPVASVSVETIEHFFPKSGFPEKAFLWENLFYCCTRCQAAKKERFDHRLLKPDDVQYDFLRYFVFDYTNGKIFPNPAARLEEQERAEVTIEHYKLNDGIIPEQRRLWLVRKSRWGGEIDDFPYRDYLE